MGHWWWSSESEPREAADGRQQVAEVARRREVLVLLGVLNHLDAVCRVECGEHRVDDLVGGRGSGGDADRAGEVVGEFVGPVDPDHPWAAGLLGQLDEGPGVGAVGRADHDDGVAVADQVEQRPLAVGGGEAEVATARRPQGRPAFVGGIQDTGPVAVAERRLGEDRHVFAEVGECVDLGGGFDAVHGLGCHGDGAHRLLVALVAYVDDLEALAGTGLDLVVDLGDERADRIDRVAADVVCPPDDVGGRTVGGEHDRCTVGDFGDVLDEHHAQRLEAFDHELVVDDLVVAVDGPVEGPDQPGEGLDGHLDTGTEAPGLGEQHAGDLHGSDPSPQVVAHPFGSLGAMSAPVVVAVASDSPAQRAGVAPGDCILAINEQVPRDVIQYQLLVDEPSLLLDVDRGGLRHDIEVDKAAGAPLGIEVDSPLFDRVQTCDNHCEFCFVYQLPPGMRRSLYLKDDDYRLSFLYGNFTTLTRFTEADLERVATERLSPLYVSIHATDPGKRTEMLRNRRGGTSLRWLRALLDQGIEVHGQVVVCPGVNDGLWLEDTLAGVAERFSELASLCVVPLGVSRHADEERMRPHTAGEAAFVVDTVEAWQGVFLAAVGRRLVFAADEYYLLAGRGFPPAEAYEGFPMHEDGIGMARSFEMDFLGEGSGGPGPRASGFFRTVDGAPAVGFRAPRTDGHVHLRARGDAPVAVLTGELGAPVLGPLVDGLGRPDVRVLAVGNRFFGGNVGVTGLLVGEDLARVLGDEPEGHRYLLPDVCLSGGRFLDGLAPDDLPRPVEVVATDGAALRGALA